MNGMDGQNKPTEENNMRQNRILNYIGVAGLLLLVVCACSKEDLNTTSDGEKGGAVVALPEGTFVVDYSVSDGETSRAGKEGRPNTSISSLLYLLYDSEGQLVKEREIPGIGTDTKWPLTRENMSWEQREALKDTLNVEMTYTAVFLANTDAELFKDASGKAEQVFFYKTVTEGADETSETTYANLQDVYLKLPSVPFNDKNMFYISKHTLSAKNADGTVVNDRETPYNCPVTLKRLVSRMDMNGIIITKELVKQGIGDNFKDIFVNGINAKYAELIESLKSQQQTNGTWIQNCNVLKGKLKLDIERDIPETFKENYVSYKEQLYTACKESVVGENNDWSMFTRMTFNLNNMHNRMSIKELTSSCDNSITLPTYTYQVTDGKATWIGFAYTESANKMLFTGITLKDEAETTTLELKFEESKEISLQKNGLVTYTCNPFNVKPSGIDYTGTFDVTINMEKVYGDLDILLSNGFTFDNATNKINDFKTAINRVLKNWENVKFKINIPDKNQFVFTTSITEQTNP